MSARTIAMRIAALGGVALIAACAPEFEGRLYMQDIVDVAASGETLIVPADLRIPESTEEECNKGLADLALKLGAITPLADDGECVEVDNSQFSQFTLDLPIATGSDGIDGDYLAELYVVGTGGPNAPGYELTLKLNRTLEDVQDAIGRGENSGFSVSTGDQDQPKFVFTFENDGRDPVTLKPNYVFLDDAPGLPDQAHTITLARRESVKIRFSDVVSAYVADANSFAFATVFAAAD